MIEFIFTMWWVLLTSKEKLDLKAVLKAITFHYQDSAPFFGFWGPKKVDPFPNKNGPTHPTPHTISEFYAFSEKVWPGKCVSVQVLLKILHTFGGAYCPGTDKKRNCNLFFQ